MKPSGPGLLFAVRFLITVSISVLVMGLLRFSISSWSSFGKLYFSKNLSISSTGSNSKESACDTGDPGGLIPGEGIGYPLQYSCLEHPMDRGAWWATVHGVEKSRTRLSGFTFTFHFHALEKEMATHSSVLAWRIPGTGEPGGLPSVGSHRVGHD